MERPAMLFFPFGFLSHYLRSIVLARRYKDVFDIRFASHPLYDEYVLKEGFSIFEAERFEDSGILTRLTQFDFSWLNLPAIERVYTSQLKAIQEYRPAFVVGDNNPTMRMAAEKSNVPFISLQNGYMSKYYANTRDISRRHPAYFILRLLPGFLSPFLTRFGESRAFARIHRPFQELRTKYGLIPIDDYMDEMEGDINLICDMPGIFPQHPLPSNYFILGPLIYDAPENSAPLSFPRDPGKKTIFVNMGSTGQWPQVSFLNDDRFRRYNIITAGCPEPVFSTGIACHFPFAYASAILPLTDLVICHGGNGIVNQCLRYGVPMLFKTTFFEQEWNARAVEKIGWGKSLDHIESPRQLDRLIEHWAGIKPALYP